VQAVLTMSGQTGPVPGQTAARVATPSTQVAERHSTVVGKNPSLGQEAEVPEHDSAASHSPAAGRHATVAMAKASAGQPSEVPSQTSGRSQGPAAERQTVGHGAGEIVETSLVHAYSPER
jgi:hypothetical protein